MENFNHIPTERLDYLAEQALAMQRWHLDLYTKNHDDEDLWIADFYAGRAAPYKEEVFHRLKTA